MQLSSEDMKALSILDVESLAITVPQKAALGRVVQSLRGFLAMAQEQGFEPSGSIKTTGLKVVE